MAGFPALSIDLKYRHFVASVLPRFFILKMFWAFEPDTFVLYLVLLRLTSHGRSGTRHMATRRPPGRWLLADAACGVWCSACAAWPFPGRPSGTVTGIYPAEKRQNIIDMPVLLNWGHCLLFSQLPAFPTSRLNVNGGGRLSKRKASNWRDALQEMGERKDVQDKRRVDTLVTARALQASPRIQDKRERDVVLLPITLERMEWFYYTFLTIRYG